MIDCFSLRDLRYPLGKVIAVIGRICERAVISLAHSSDLVHSRANSIDCRDTFCHARIQ